MIRSLFSTLLLIITVNTGAQQVRTVIKGHVKDTSGVPVSLVNVSLKGMPYGTFTGDDGSYELSLPYGNKDYLLVFSSIGYMTHENKVIAISDTITINVVLLPGITRLKDVNIREYYQRDAPSVRNIPIKDIRLIPASGGSIEKLLISMPGINSVNELSNRYMVRGGSYAENLVYINDIEIYHPLLIKTGQQEGLSFLNPDLIRSVSFSAGGFNASYGDILSSVLDIRYKTPAETRASLNLGLLLNTAHLEGKIGKFSFLAGARLKTNRFLVQTLDTRGNYKPLFFDIQSMLRYSISKKASLNLFAAYNSNKYSFIPASRTSSFGNYQEAYQLYVLYNGSETDRYDSYNLALSVDINLRKGLSNKFIAHYYNSYEQETYDIRGSYSLNRLDKNLGSENFGDSIMNIGIGSWLSHARNRLNINVYTMNYKGQWILGDNTLSWGAKFRLEAITDRIREWEKIDSAGFSVPISDELLLLSNVISNGTSLSSTRLESYLINSYSLDISGHNIVVSGGGRLSYLSFSDEILFSPRLSISWALPSKKLRYYISGGIYYQPPYYREMRYPSGSVNTSIKSQKSVHTVFGADYDFTMGSTPFHLSVEAYYKALHNIIPYKYDNIRIIYSAENSAEGYVRGIDLRLNGEFVKNAESWVSMSVMDAKHNILNDDYGYFPAPSDTRFSVNVFFQDYFPSNPNYRAHINLHYSTGIPVSSPYTDRYDSYRRMPPYRRVDIGFTRVIKSNKSSMGINFLSYFDEIIAGIEVFNLLDIRNTISYNWLTTVNNLSGESRQFAVPNYLTGRSLNLKFMVKF